MKKITILILTVFSINIYSQEIETENWITDLNFLKTELPKKHKNLFFKITKNEFENGIDKKFFSTAFKWACWRNNPSIAKYLLECGADYKSETTSKSELLFWICGLGHKEIIKLLLELNVDFKTKVKFKGKMMAYDGSPLDRAIATNQTEIVKLINAD